MLRFHKFTIGHAWCTDFGDPGTADLFHYLRQYSPYHNVRQPAEGQYPATMLTTASHDDRYVASAIYMNMPLFHFSFIRLSHGSGSACWGRDV